jgi:hypothetical protein
MLTTPLLASRVCPRVILEMRRLRERALLRLQPPRALGLCASSPQPPADNLPATKVLDEVAARDEATLKSSDCTESLKCDRLNRPL